MSNQIEKINDLLSYLDKYKEQITDENHSQELNHIVNSLFTLKLVVETPKPESFPESHSWFFSDRIVRYIDSLQIPELAKTTQRVFKAVVMKDLQTSFGNCMEIPAFQKECAPLDYKTQAENYEQIAAKSLDEDLIKKNLLCALSCLRSIEDDSAKRDIQRVELLLTTLRLSKLIRGGEIGSDDLLDEITASPLVTQENLIDALDVHSPGQIIEALVKKLPELSESCFVVAIRNGRVDALKSFLDLHVFLVKEEWLYTKALQFGKANVLEFLFSRFPNLKVASKDFDNMDVLSAPLFEVLIRQFIKNPDNKIPLSTLERVYRRFQYYRDPEKFVDALAPAFVKTNDIASFQTLKDLPGFMEFRYENPAQGKLATKIIELAHLQEIDTLLKCDTTRSIDELVYHIKLSPPASLEVRARLNELSEKFINTDSAGKIQEVTPLLDAADAAEIVRRIEEWKLRESPNSDLSRAEEILLKALKDKKEIIHLRYLLLTSLPDIFRFPFFADKLTVLNLEGNLFTSLPKEICALKKLRCLYMSGNRLISLPPEIKELHSLHVLDLSGNRLQSLPVEIGNLRAIKDLSLSNNGLTSLPKEIGNNQTLLQLHLQNNHLTEVPDEISQLKNLLQLNLDHNFLNVISKAICQLGKLTTLFLSKNRITVLPHEIGNLQDLCVLHLEANTIRDLPSGIFQLKSLEILDLTSNHLEYLHSEIGALSSLQFLRLDHNRLSTVPVEVGQLRNLVHLGLRSSPELTGIPMELLNLHLKCLIDINDCRSFSQATLLNLANVTRSPSYRGPRISFSMLHTIQPNTTEQSIESSLQSLYQIVQRPYKKLEHLPDVNVSEPALRSWLARLSYVGDYKASPEKRRWLVATILDYLKLADTDPEFRQVFGAIIDGAADTCGDRVALSIVHLGIAHRLAKIDTSNMKNLAHFLIRGVFAMSLLEEIARNKVPTLPFFDEIEVYLGYPVKLKEKLQLPIDIEGMLFFSCSALKQCDLDEAATCVLSKIEDEATRLKFLISNDRWLKALSQNYPQEFAAIEKEKNTRLENAKTDQDFTHIQESHEKNLIELSQQVL